MKLINSIKEIASNEKIFFTIGNFDGVHLGHRQFLKFIKDEAQKVGARFLVITFVPHPSFVLKNQRAFLLNTYSERREMLKDLGVEYLFEIDFNRDFSTLSPGDFLDDYIFNHPGITKMFLGHDFAFGANKSGDFNFVKDYCANRKIDLFIQDEYKFMSSNVSSSAVRSHVKSGAMDLASNFLGRNYFISGRVIKGAGRGKQIGFPTANLGYERECLVPSNGVYITKTYFKEMTYQSVTNVGHNPTFNTGLDIHVETHLLDFNSDIYGEEIRVEFIKKLRDEKKFSSANELIQQIKTDVENSRKYFS